LAHIPAWNCSTPGHDVTVFDNFCNSQPEALARVERITGKKFTLFEGDIRDRPN
jgi:UDP-glucose 4-epimerase